jgi:hypothetical protein
MILDGGIKLKFGKLKRLKQEYCYCGFWTKLISVRLYTYSIAKRVKTTILLDKDVKMKHRKEA